MSNCQGNCDFTDQSTKFGAVSPYYVISEGVPPGSHLVPLGIKLPPAKLKPVTNHI